MIPISRTQQQIDFTTTFLSTEKNQVFYHLGSATKKIMVGEYYIKMHEEPSGPATGSKTPLFLLAQVVPPKNPTFWH